MPLGPYEAVRGCVDRDGVVTETDARNALRVELEPGELFVSPDFGDREGVGVQVYRLHAESNTPHD